MSCLSEKELSYYLDERFSEKERNKIEEHIAGCRHCLDLLLIAYDAGKAKKKWPRIKKGHGALKWLLGSITSIAFSFVFRKFFLQFLITAVIVGFKWVMESEGARKTIMIFKGIKSEETPDIFKRYHLPANPHRKSVRNGKKRKKV